MNFNLGIEYTCSEIHTVLGGNQQTYLPIQAVPVFIKRKPGGWEYQGLFRVVASFVQPADCAPYRRSGSCA